MAEGAAIRQRRQHEIAGPCSGVEGDALSKERVGTCREMRPMLLGRSHGENSDYAFLYGPADFLKCPGRPARIGGHARRQYLAGAVETICGERLSLC